MMGMILLLKGDEIPTAEAAAAGAPSQTVFYPGDERAKGKPKGGRKL